MTWRYRVGTKHGFTGIIEYYEWDDGKKVSFTGEFVSPIGETERELIQDIRMMLRAFDEPVVDMGAKG